jgi:hypothetical protein
MGRKIKTRENSLKAYKQREVADLVNVNNFLEFNGYEQPF